MKGTVFSSCVAIMAVVLFASAMGGGCANPIAPQGGPKDTLAPIMVDATPQDSTLQFNQKKIVFAFDEYVQLDNWRDNLVVSPLLKTDPTIESKLRTVTIRIKDTLDENTTYSFNFGKAIKDVNEGNVIRNFTYVFSTGKYIDSLELTGRVMTAQTGKPDSTLIVMLHRSSDDSAVIKQKPRYIAKLDKDGHFHFRNLPPGVFYLYALEDQGNQRKYSSPAQLFAFADKPITIGRYNPPDTLYAYVEKKDAPKPSTTHAAATKTDKDKEKEKDKRLKFNLNLENGLLDLLGNLELTFNDPLKNFDSSKVLFTNEAYTPITNYRIQKDTGNKKFTLIYKWPENASFKLILNRDFAEDSIGRKIPRTDTLSFKTKKESDYGNVNIRFSNLDFSKKPVLQLIQSDAIKYSAPLTNRDFRVPLFKPGEYDMRILLDTNNNGIWDTGEFFKTHRQPERVISIPKKLNIKANWDNDYNVEL